MSDSVTPWTIACQAALSVGFSKQEYWNPSPGDLPDPGIKPSSPALKTDSLLSEPPWKPGRGLEYRAKSRFSPSEIGSMCSHRAT